MTIYNIENKEKLEIFLESLVEINLNEINILREKNGLVKNNKNDFEKNIDDKIKEKGN